MYFLSYSAGWALFNTSKTIFGEYIFVDSCCCAHKEPAEKLLHEMSINFQKNFQTELPRVFYISNCVVLKIFLKLNTGLKNIKKWWKFDLFWRLNKMCSFDI